MGTKDERIQAEQERLLSLLPKEPTGSTEKGDKLLQFLQAHSK